jgi:tetratricopeptide (TPR) repeat protein
MAAAPASYTAELVATGLRHADRALALDSADADALEARGTLRYWQWLSNLGGGADAAAKLYQDAERDLRAAVDVNPGQASAWTTLSHLLINKPAAAEAKLAAMRAYEADPYLTNANVTVWRLFLTSYQLEDPVEAERWCREGQRRFADDVRFAECHLWYFSMPGATVQIDDAWHVLDRFIALSPPSLRPLNRLSGQMRIAMALARTGNADSARRVAQRSRGNASIDPERELAELEAIVYAALGDKDAAFELLSVYVASNPQQRQAVASWEFRPLEGDPRYATLLSGR